MRLLISIRNFFSHQKVRQNFITNKHLYMDAFKVYRKRKICTTRKFRKYSNLEQIRRGCITNNCT